MPALLLAESKILITKINKNFYRSVRNNRVCLVERNLGTGQKNTDQIGLLARFLSDRSKRWTCSMREFTDVVYTFRKMCLRKWDFQGLYFLSFCKICKVLLLTALTVIFFNPQSKPKTENVSSCLQC